jgi:hypothetical protein
MVSQISKSWYRKSAKQQLLTPQTQCTIHDHQMEPEQDQESTSNSKFTAINANAACDLSTAGKRQSADPRSAPRRLAPTSAIKTNQFIDGHQLSQLTIQGRLTNSGTEHRVKEMDCRKLSQIDPRTQHWAMDNISFHTWTSLSNSWRMPTFPNVKLFQMSLVFTISLGQ